MVLWQFPMTFNHRYNYLLLSANHDKSVSAVTGPDFSFLPYEQSIKIHTEVSLWNFSPETRLYFYLWKVNDMGNAENVLVIHLL